jgi:predicted NBD/HSP70 family sugar kinase
LKAAGVDIELVPISHHPDEAGLIGAVYLMPEWMVKGHEAMLAVDIGGTNVRAGIVKFGKGKSRNGDQIHVMESILWRHADDAPSRTATIAKLVEMLEELIEKAKAEHLKLAPLIGIGCPGVIEVDGSIKRGGQNLPGGNWESDHFNLPAALTKALPEIAGESTFIMMHNDAVVQGLSQMPHMGDVSNWAVLTIGTGLGNAHFTNRASKED